MAKCDSSVSASPASDLPGDLQACGARQTKPARRGRIGLVLLLPVLVPAALLMAFMVEFVVGTLAKVTLEVSSVVLGQWRWLSWVLAILLVRRVIKKWPRRQLEAQPQPEAEPRPRPVPAQPPAATAYAPSPLAQLAARTRTWLGEQQSALPAALQARVQSMQAQLVELATQLRDAKPAAHVSAELEQLLREELPQLIQAYLKVPSSLKQRTVHGGTSPEQQLTAGLATLDAQLGSLHERLAAEDLQALAVHQRYLDLKYNPPGSASG